MKTIYSQNICKVGHYFLGSSFKCCFMPDYIYEGFCPICGKGVVWTNYVDNSELDNLFYIPIELFRVIPTTRTKICIKNSDNTYNEIIKTIVGVYRVPTKEEVKDFRRYIYEDESNI